MSHTRRAAVMLMALGPQVAAQVLRTMDEPIVEAISREIVRFDRLPPARRLELLDAARAELAGLIRGVDGNMEQFRLALFAALGLSPADRRPARSSDPPGPFHFLWGQPPNRIATIVAGESAQTIALVLSYAPATLAAQVLTLLPAWVRLEVAHRLVGLQPVHPSTVEVLRTAIRRKLDRLLTEEHLRQFSFADIATLDDASLKELLGHLRRKVNGVAVGWDDLIVALQGSGLESVVARLGTALAPAEADRLRREVARRPRVPGEAIVAAQRHVVRTLRTLQERGVICLSPTLDETLDPVAEP
ncbi:MAG: hypothetical protein HYY04_14315 [Chloroflexi bacterium]|nr:hypothetical protein [Chloroflexota bacterium]